MPSKLYKVTPKGTDVERLRQELNTQLALISSRLDAHESIGGTVLMKGNIDMGGFKLVNSAVPSDDNDAVTMAHLRTQSLTPDADGVIRVKHKVEHHKPVVHHQQTTFKKQGNTPHEAVRNSDVVGGSAANDVVTATPSGVSIPNNTVTFYTNSGLFNTDMLNMEDLVHYTVLVTLASPAAGVNFDLQAKGNPSTTLYSSSRSVTDKQGNAAFHHMVRVPSSGVGDVSVDFYLLQDSGGGATVSGTTNTTVMAIR